MSKRLQKNIYKEGKRIVVKKMVYSSDKRKKHVTNIPCPSLEYAVDVVSKIVASGHDMASALEIERDARIACGMNPVKKGHRDESNIIQQNNKFLVVKEIEGKRCTWKCNSHDEAVLLRDKLRVNNWKLDPDEKVPASKRKSVKPDYGRFEEVKDFPSIRCKSHKPQEVVKKPQGVVNPLVVEMAKRYSVSSDEMTELCLMIGLNHLQQLNFIPEYGD